LAFIAIAHRIILPIMVTIRQLCINWVGRVEILVFDQNRFIRSQIRKRFKEVKNSYQRRRVIVDVKASTRFWDVQSTCPYQTDGL
jgi:hypothetical protein